MYRYIVTKKLLDSSSSNSFFSLIELSDKEAIIAAGFTINKNDTYIINCEPGYDEEKYIEYGGSTLNIIYDKSQLTNEEK